MRRPGILAGVLSGLLWSTLPHGVAVGAGEAVPEPTSDRGVEYLVPEMENRGFALADGKRPYQHRIAFSPAFGQLGSDPYYALRFDYSPRAWLGWEAHLGHNPSTSVHALVHALLVQLRWPLSGRLQPYLSFGYGMMLIFPGRVFSADPVTRNQLGAGAGLEFFLRDDVALRGEWRGTTLLGDGGDGAEGAVNYDYREFTLGLSFYRTIEP